MYGCRGFHLWPHPLHKLCLHQFFEGARTWVPPLPERKQEPGGMFAYSAHKRMSLALFLLKFTSHTYQPSLNAIEPLCPRSADVYKWRNILQVAPSCTDTQFTHNHSIYSEGTISAANEAWLLQVTIDFIQFAGLHVSILCSA